MELEKYDTIIVGSGPAGLTAAIYNVRAALKTLVIAGNQPGGQLTITTYVDNYPGFPTGIGGLKLMMDMQAQVKNLGVEIRNGLVKTIVGDKSEGFQIELEDGTKMVTKAVIVTTGAKAKWLGIPGEERLIGKGVSGCATCDGMFFRDKVVVVVGGGDTACQDAVFLSKFAKKVYLVHRRDSLRASKIEQNKALNNEKIEVLWNTEVKEAFGEEKLQMVKIVDNVKNTERDLITDGLFVAIGHLPATEFLGETITKDPEGQIITGLDKDYPMMTSQEGIFAAGDCTSINSYYKQAVAAAGDGCKAALDAERWIENQKFRG